MRKLNKICAKDNMKYDSYSSDRYSNKYYAYLSSDIEWKIREPDGWR